MSQVMQRVPDTISADGLLSEVDVEQHHARFAAFCDGYCGGERPEPNLLLKRDHSLRVASRARDIACGLGCSPGAIRLAEICGLYHDLGRFPQYARWGTFVDAHSADHAALGVEELHREGFLEDLSAELRNIILTAITWHNRLLVDEDLDPQQRFYCLLLRDADKLDIWRVLTDYYRARGDRNTALELGLDESVEISPAVLGDVLAGRLVRSADLRTVCDFKLLQMGWVYDLNFVPSLRLLADGGYLEMIRDSFPVGVSVDGVYAAVRGYRDRILSEG